MCLEQLELCIRLLFESEGTSGMEGVFHVTFKIPTPENREIGNGLLECLAMLIEFYLHVIISQL